MAETIKKNHTGFTLIELLIVISIIAIILSILTPAIRQCRQIALQLKCGANTGAIALGLTMYSTDFDDKLPASYTYTDSGTEFPLIRHWSYVLDSMNCITAKHLVCPAFKNGGLPPRSTVNDNLENGQVSLIANMNDLQVSRCAYTVNEAICPRNRFAEGFEGALRRSRYVKSSEIKSTGNTVLITEWTDKWQMISEDGDGICSSYLPINGVRALGTSKHNDLNAVPISPGKPCFKGGIYEKRYKNELSMWQSAVRVYPPRLDWIGRNHGLKKSSTQYDLRKSNFAYMDGHVECKSVFETIGPDFEWGDRMYSIDSGNNNVK